MPGRPNKPPDIEPAPPSLVPIPETPQQKALRRLVPTRVALLLDTWKGAPSPELAGPCRKAEEAFAQGDYAAALSSLDLLSIRFAEPRWPTLPEPFRFLRVPIPKPVPPHWDPDHALPPADKDAKRARKTAEEQLGLAKGCLAWATSHGVDATELAPLLEAAAGRLSDPAGLAPFYAEVDAFWTGLHGRLPAPKTGSAPPPAVATTDAEEP
jgi:hypothetical protein